MRLLPIVLVALAVPASALEPAVATWDHFGAAIFDVYLHQQQHARAVFNSQNSQRITQSSEAQRLQFEWRWQPEFVAIAGFLLPVRDETIREGKEEVERFHYPKQVLVGVGWDALRTPLSEKGALELGVAAGALVGLASPIVDELLPWVEADARLALTSGSALQVGLQYQGIGSRGSFGFVLGASQRF